MLLTVRFACSWRGKFHIVIVFQLLIGKKKCQSEILFFRVRCNENLRWTSFWFNSPDKFALPHGNICRSHAPPRRKVYEIYTWQLFNTTDSVRGCYKGGILKQIPIIVGVIANSHHTIWLSSDPNTRGYFQLDFILTNDLEICELAGKPILVTSIRTEVLDITPVLNSEFLTRSGIGM